MLVLLIDRYSEYGYFVNRSIMWIGQILGLVYLFFKSPFTHLTPPYNTIKKQNTRNNTFHPNMFFVSIKARPTPSYAPGCVG